MVDDENARRGGNAQEKVKRGSEQRIKKGTMVPNKADLKETITVCDDARN